MKKVTHYLQLLNASNSSGPDDVSPQVLMEIPLLKRFPTSLSGEKLLWERKLENAPKIFKKSDKKCALNYCSISLTSIPRKTMENMIGNKPTNFLKEKRN